MIWPTTVRLLAYFVTVLALLLATIFLAPQFYEFLPFGGLAEIEANRMSGNELQGSVSGKGDMLEVVATATSIGIGRLEGAATLFFAMLGSLALMVPVAWVYRAINVNTDYDHSLAATIMLLPPVVAGIVIVVQHSLALAFSLAGIAAAVRFRRALIDTTDTLFIFVAIAVGIAAGIEALGVALVLSLFFCFAATFICLGGEGLESHQRMRRKQEKQELREKQHNELLAATRQNSGPGNDQNNDQNNDLGNDQSVVHSVDDDTGEKNEKKDDTGHS